MYSYLSPILAFHYSRLPTSSSAELYHKHSLYLM